MFIDTHCHLNFEQFSGEVGRVIDQAREAGVERMINVGTDVTTSRISVEFAKRYPVVFASVGIHPHDAESLDIAAMQELFVLARQPKVVAIGEIGLDYFRLERSGKFAKNPTVEQQKIVFGQLLDMALELNVPVIVHSREAATDVHDQLVGYQGKLRGVQHAFSYSWIEAKQLLDLGWYISFAGNLTYPQNKHLQEVARLVPSDRLLLETDAPFLPPENKRGKRCEPQDVRTTAECLAALRGLTLDAVGKLTSANARTLFGLKA